MDPKGKELYLKKEEEKEGKLSHVIANFSAALINLALHLHIQHPVVTNEST